MFVEEEEEEEEVDRYALDLLPISTALTLSSHSNWGIVCMRRQAHACAGCTERGRRKDKEEKSVKVEKCRQGDARKCLELKVLIWEVSAVVIGGI